MNHNTQNTIGRGVLIGLLCTLVLLIALLSTIATLGTAEQFAHAKELLPILVALTTPLTTAIATAYFQK